MNSLIPATALLALLGACSGLGVPTQPPTPTPVVVPVQAPVAVCPGDPPPGYVCSPPILCRDAPEALAWDNRWITSVFFTPEQRQGAAMMILGFEKAFCGGAATPAGTMMRRKLA